MNNEPMKFNDAMFGNLRVIVRDGEPWFVAKDVAEMLGYSRPKDAIAAHCKGAAKHRLLTPGGAQEMTIIPERDLYRLIMRSKLPEAERFEEWVVGTILPAIRKDGGYIMGEEKVAKGELSGGLCSRPWASVFC